MRIQDVIIRALDVGILPVLGKDLSALFCRSRSSSQTTEIDMNNRSNQTLSRRAVLGIGISFLFCTPAWANDFQLSIQNPTNNPIWTKGNAGSVTWTWTGGPLPATFSHWKVRIVNAASPGVEYLNSAAGSSTTPPASYNFTVPTAGGSSTIIQCNIIVEGYDSTNPYAIITASQQVQIYTP